MLAEDLHLVWPAGAENVVALLAADRVPGIPRDPDTLADILLERGLAIPRQDGNQSQRYWRLAPEPLARDGQVVTLSMLRLASPDLVLAGAPPAAVGLALASEPATLEMVSEVPVERSADEPTEEGVGAVEEGTSSTAAMHALSAARPPTEQPAISPVGQGTDPNDHHGHGASQAVAWLRTRGAGGEVLLALAELLSADPRAQDQRTRRKGEQLIVLFPDGLAGLGAAPQAHLDALANAGLLDVNPLTPLRRVTEIDGQHGALLTLDASRRVLALIADARPELQAPPAEAPSVDLVPRLSADPGAARDLVKRIRARDRSLPGGVSEAPGWLRVGPETLRGWAQDQGVPIYVLIRTLGHLPGCRVTPEGGLAVRSEP
jgi:conjugal transfer pilus assembly protein TraI